MIDNENRTKDVDICYAVYQTPFVVNHIFIDVDKTPCLKVVVILTDMLKMVD